jgi:uncharacterized protein (UPF0335 family)
VCSLSYPSNSDSVAHDQIRAFVERIERLHEERKAIGDDIKEIYAEAKGNGFDTKALKIVVRNRAMDQSERMELESIIALYESALGGRAETDDEDEPEPRAPARVENIEQFGDDIGDSEAIAPVQAADQSTAARMDVRAGSVGETAGREMAAQLDPVHAPQAGTQAPPVDTPPERHPAALNALKLRPYCLHADDLRQCGGVGKKHCFACQKAHADAAGDSA